MKLLLSLLTLAAVITSSAMAQLSRDCNTPRFDNSAYCVLRRPLSIAVGDLDGDGNLDLASAMQFGPIGDTVAILFGCGDGTLGDIVSYDGGFEPFSVVFGDLDADGDLDLVSLDAGGVDFNGALPGSVSVLLNTSDGTLFVHMILDLGLGPQSLALSDLDGDGQLDIVTREASNAVGVLLNKGNETFAAAEFFRVGSEPLKVAIGDLNGDGALDLAVVNVASDNVSILLNRSNDCSGTPGDLDGNCTVGVSDLLTLFANWGPCS